MVDKDKFPFWGPRSGTCVRCGKHLGAYWNKYIERTTGRVGCEEHHLITDPYGPDWDHYSDG